VRGEQNGLGSQDGWCPGTFDCLVCSKRTCHDCSACSPLRCPREYPLAHVCKECSWSCQRCASAIGCGLCPRSWEEDKRPASFCTVCSTVWCVDCLHDHDETARCPDCTFKLSKIGCLVEQRGLAGFPRGNRGTWTQQDILQLEVPLCGWIC